MSRKRALSLAPMRRLRRFRSPTPSSVPWAIIVGLILVVVAPIVYPRGPLTYAIKDARIITVTNGVLSKGTVVLRDGLIEAIGQHVEVPEDARVIDGRGLTVYPGLIDAHAEVALRLPTSTRRQTGQASERPPRPPTPSKRPSLHPDRLAAALLQADDARLDKFHRAGITTALTIPRRGIFIGQSALINLAGDEPARMVIRSPVAMHIGFDRTGGFRTFPGSLMGVVAYIRQTLYDAQHYELEWSRYRRLKRGIRRPAWDKALEALQPVLNGKEPVVFVANEAKEIRRVIALVDEFNLNAIISGAHEGYAVAALLAEKGIPVLVSLNFPTQPKGADPQADVPLRVLRLRARAPQTPAALYRAGVKFAFTSGFMDDPKDFLANAAKAIEAGLPEEEAIKALTINAAEIFGVDEQLGSIEVGKIANVVVTDGDLFDRKTKITHLFIDGRQIELKEAPKTPGVAEEQPTVDASGTWELTVESPQGPISVTAVLEQAGNKITGTLTSMFGTTNTEGTVSGATIRFTATVDVQGQSMDVEFEGTIEGNAMKGTVSVQGQGEFSFTGTRPQKGAWL